MVEMINKSKSPQTTSLGLLTSTTSSRTSKPRAHRRNGKKSSGMTCKMVSYFSASDLFLFTAHFIVWMRTAGLPNFRKLWGKITEDLQPGEYYLMIGNNYEVKPF